MVLEPRRFAHEEMLSLAAKAVARVDRDGVRGASLISMDELMALVCFAALSGLLPIPGKAKGVNETPIFRTRRKRP